MLWSNNTSMMFVWTHRIGREGGGEGGRGQVSASLHTETPAAPREEALHRGVLLEPGCKTRSDSRHNLQGILSDPLRLFFIQGDQHEPDQQSDSEEGSTKGDPQVTQHVDYSDSRLHFRLISLPLFFIPPSSPHVISSSSL